ncbi:MAG: hypothetical protein QXG58_07585 [Candidatus Bathyarchaeia archaeon]
MLDVEVWDAIFELVNAFEAGILSFKKRLSEQKGVAENLLWNPEKIRWEPAEGQSGPYERSEDVNNPEFQAMLKDLARHKGKLTRNGWFYWTFKNGSTVGRKKRG